MSKSPMWALVSGLAMIATSNAAAQTDAEPTEEIVVTATGRASSLQDVPLAVTALSSEVIEQAGVQDLRDITQLAASFEMSSGQSNSSGTTARIRGIGTGSDNPGFESAVGIFIDGVYRARAGAALADLPELERVEVLRGPQGTLFGRNTSAGAISVVTAGPDFDPGMYLEATLGLDDLGETGARAGVNAPVTDNFALRFDGSIRARDGYITDTASGEDINDRERWSLRGQAIWDISPDASLRVIVDHAESDEACCGVTPLIYGTTQSAINATLGSAIGSPAIDVDGRSMSVTPGRSYGEQTDDSGVSAELNWDLGSANLTSITAYRDWNAVRDQDVDFNYVDIAYRDGLEVGFETFTQELRLQGEAGRVNWLVGLFYADEQMETQDAIRIGADASLYANYVTLGATAALTGGPYQLYNYVSGAPSVFALANPALGGFYLSPNASGQGQQSDAWNVDTQSLALFTHNEIALSDRLTLTLGARYSYEEKELNASLYATSASCSSLQALESAYPGVVSGLEGAGLSSLLNLACNPAVNPIANGDWADSREEGEWTGTASLAYDLTDAAMIYASYARGYKAGGFNVDRSGFELRPSTIDVSTLSTDQLEFEGEFTDALEAGVKTNLGRSATLNLAIFRQEIHDYQLNAFNGYNFITRNIPEVVSQGGELELQARVGDRLTLGGGVTYTDAYFDSTVVFNAAAPDGNTVNAGDPLAFAPEWVVTGSALYEQPLTQDLRALFYLDARWNDGYRTQTLGREASGATDNDAFAIFNGRIGVGPEDDRWSVELWGRNLTDETYAVGAFSPPLQNSYVIYANEPATYGVTVRARY